MFMIGQGQDERFKCQWNLLKITQYLWSTEDLELLGIVYDKWKNQIGNFSKICMQLIFFVLLLHSVLL